MIMDQKTFGRLPMAVGVLILLGGSLPLLAQNQNAADAAKGGGSSSNTSVTATFRDASILPDGTGIPDRIKSDGGGAYVNGVGNVKAIIDGVGDFDLDTSDSPGATETRWVFLDFTNCATMGACTPLFTSGLATTICPS